MIVGAGRIKNVDDFRFTVVNALKRLLLKQSFDSFFVYPQNSISDIVLIALTIELGVSSGACTIISNDSELNTYCKKPKQGDSLLIIDEPELTDYDTVRENVAHVSNSFTQIIDLFPDRPLQNSDARIVAFEMTSREIARSNVEGNIAEVGVFQGYTAQYLNTFFPNRKLLLFDTFEGFDSRDCEIEEVNSYSTFSKGMFSNTSMEIVREKMPHPENCEFHKGYFPESAKGIEDRFAFVHLDADLYHPIYEGLCFFYPRLSSGGYIFVHDFSGETCRGVRAAVLKFCEENKLGYVLMPDSIEHGTAVIVKR